ncbi:MAG TPA: laccase domain-containing protein, partial [Casimicrobium huifangae]|nr:laccase domain-containing protein [Casimicrobium huifangae]
EDVRAAFVSQDSDAAAHFYALPKLPNSDTVPSPPKFLCDLAAIARQRLAALGVAEVVSSDACTYSEPERFFSHRRDRTTGRMAAFVWIE